MNLFSIFKKQKFDINVDKNGVFINGAKCEFELSKFLKILGEARIIDDGEGRSRYFWDEAGIFAFIAQDKLEEIDLMLKPSKDIRHNLPKRPYNGKFTLDDLPMISAMPIEKLREAYIFLDVKLGRYEVSLQLSDEVQEKIDKFSFQQRLEKMQTDEIADIVRAAKEPVERVCITYKEKRAKKRLSEKYLLAKPVGDTLNFKNFNFKLAVLNELMYEKELLKPKFDVFEFCDELDIDPYESFGALPQAKRWFKEYALPLSLADEISEIYLDAGNEIYLQVAPDWDGEDELFDIKSIDKEELAQFKNLKKITINSLAISKKARKICADAGILIEE